MTVTPGGNRNPANKPLNANGEREWTHGLCDCFGDCGTCESHFCVVTSLGSISSRLSLSFLIVLPHSNGRFSFITSVHCTPATFRHGSSGCSSVLTLLFPGFVAWFCPCMIYQSNKSRREALEHGAPHPQGGENTGSDCGIFGILQCCVGAGWVLEVSRFSSFSPSNSSTPSTTTTTTTTTTALFYNLRPALITFSLSDWRQSSNSQALQHRRWWRLRLRDRILLSPLCSHSRIKGDRRRREELRRLPKGLDSLLILDAWTVSLSLELSFFLYPCTPFVLLYASNSFL